jgi:hypothetical protein
MAEHEAQVFPWHTGGGRVRARGDNQRAPRRRVLRGANRRQAFILAYGKARSDAARLQAACDYLRGALVSCPHLAGHVWRELATGLVGEADRIYRELAIEAGRDARVPRRRAS